MCRLVTGCAQQIDMTDFFNGSDDDIFTLGVIHSLKSIIKSIKDTGESADEVHCRLQLLGIDFQEVLERQRRNLSDPDLEKYIVLDDVSEMEKLR